jgi:hypothetical protein
MERLAPSVNDKFPHEDEIWPRTKKINRHKPNQEETAHTEEEPNGGASGETARYRTTLGQLNEDTNENRRRLRKKTPGKGAAQKS